MEISDFQKFIYNSYLRAYAEKQGRGYRKAVNFDNLKEINAVSLVKLEKFFNQYSHIKPLDFFKAGFELSVDDFVPLHFFCTRKAISFYSKYIRNRYYSSPDSKETLESFVNGLKFINAFLKEKNLTLKEYRTAVNTSSVPYFLEHLHNQNISFYHLHAFLIGLDEIPKDWKELIVQDFDKVFKITEQNYFGSKKMLKIGNVISNTILKY